MIEISFPSPSLFLDENAKILLDANIIINQLYDYGNIGKICSYALKLFRENKAQVYLSSVVISEVLNRILYIEFKTDMYYQVYSEKPISNPKTLDKIVSIFNTYKDISFSLMDINSLKNTNFTKCFNLLNKEKRNRFMLKPYYDRVMEIYNEFKQESNFQYLGINEDTYSKALENFQCQMLGVNDSQHLQVAIDNNMDYIMTTDKDFSFVAQRYDVKILKIDKNSIMPVEEKVAIGDVDKE